MTSPNLKIMKDLRNYYNTWNAQSAEWKAANPLDAYLMAQCPNFYSL